MMSSGVFIHSKIGRHKTHTITAITIENTRDSRPRWPCISQSAVISRPEPLGHRMAKPLHTPMQKPIIMKFREPVEPTAASAFTPRYFPYNNRIDML